MDPASEPDEIGLIAARLLVNLLTVSAHDTRAEIAVKTGIDPERLSTILRGLRFPDLYEIAAFERAYNRPLWPDLDFSS